MAAIEKSSDGKVAQLVNRLNRRPIIFLREDPEGEIKGVLQSPTQSRRSRFRRIGTLPPTRAAHMRRLELSRQMLTIDDITIPIATIAHDGTVGLPPQKEGFFHVVSQIVAFENPQRDDLLVVNEKVLKRGVVSLGKYVFRKKPSST